MAKLFEKTIWLFSRLTDTSESADSAGPSKSRGRSMFSKGNRSNQRATTAGRDDRSSEASDHARRRRSTGSSSRLEASDVQDSIRHKGTRRRRPLSRESDPSTYGRNGSHQPFKDAYHLSTNASNEALDWTDCFIPDMRVFHTAPVPPGTYSGSMPVCECLEQAAQRGQGTDDCMLKSTSDYPIPQGRRMARRNPRKQRDYTKTDTKISDTALAGLRPSSTGDVIVDSTHGLLDGGPIMSSDTPESSWDDDDDDGDSLTTSHQLPPMHSRLSEEGVLPYSSHDTKRCTYPGGSYPSIFLSGKGTVTPEAQTHRQSTPMRNANRSGSRGLDLEPDMDGDAYHPPLASRRSGQRSGSRAGTFGDRSTHSSFHADIIYDPAPACRQLGRLRDRPGAWTSALTHLLTELSGEQVVELGQCYLSLYGTLLTSEVKKRLKGCFQELCHAAALGPWSSEVFWIHQYGDPSYTKASQFVIEALIGRSNADIEGINAASRSQKDNGHILDSYVFRYRDTLSHLLHVALAGGRQSEDTVISPEEVKAFMLELRQAFRYQPDRTKEIPIIDALMKKSDAFLLMLKRAYKSTYKIELSGEFIKKCDRFCGPGLKYLLDGMDTREMRDAWFIHDGIQNCAASHDKVEMALLGSRILRLHWDPCRTYHTDLVYQEINDISIVDDLWLLHRHRRYDLDWMNWTGFLIELAMNAVDEGARIAKLI